MISSIHSFYFTPLSLSLLYYIILYYIIHIYKGFAPWNVRVVSSEPMDGIYSDLTISIAVGRSKILCTQYKAEDMGSGFPGWTPCVSVISFIQMHEIMLLLSLYRIILYFAFDKYCATMELQSVCNRFLDGRFVQAHALVRY